MFGLGTGELLVVALLALIFIGPERLPDLATRLGKVVRQVRHAINEMKEDFKA